MSSLLRCADGLLMKCSNGLLRLCVPIDAQWRVVYEPGDCGSCVNGYWPGSWSIKESPEVLQGDDVQADLAETVVVDEDLEEATCYGAVWNLATIPASEDAPEPSSTALQCPCDKANPDTRYMVIGYSVWFDNPGNQCSGSPWITYDCVAWPTYTDSIACAYGGQDRRLSVCEHLGGCTPHDEAIFCSECRPTCDPAPGAPYHTVCEYKAGPFCTQQEAQDWIDANCP